MDNGRSLNLNWKTALSSLYYLVTLYIYGCHIYHYGNVIWLWLGQIKARCSNFSSECSLGHLERHAIRISNNERIQIFHGPNSRSCIHRSSIVLRTECVRIWRVLCLAYSHCSPNLLNKPSGPRPLTHPRAECSLPVLWHNEALELLTRADYSQWHKYLQPNASIKCPWQQERGRSICCPAPLNYCSSAIFISAPMDSFDFFQLLSLSSDSSDSTELSSSSENNSTHPDERSNDLEQILVDSERSSGFTTHGFCVVA